MEGEEDWMEQKGKGEEYWMNETHWDSIQTGVRRCGRRWRRIWCRLLEAPQEISLRAPSFHHLSRCRRERPCPTLISQYFVLVTLAFGMRMKLELRSRVKFEMTRSQGAVTCAIDDMMLVGRSPRAALKKIFWTMV